MTRAYFTTCTALVAIAITTLHSTTLSASDSARFTFPFAPARHMNAIGLPDDWHKPMITEKGDLAYDFGPGPYATPLTEIGFRIEGGGDSVVAQWFDDPRIPLAHSTIARGTDTLSTEIFTVIPAGDAAPAIPATHGRVQRRGGLNGTRYWATPPAGTDPSFRSVAWGANRPIRYGVQVPPGSARRIALGFCEPYKGTVRARLLSLQVEGAPHLTIDPMPEGVRNTPHVHLFDAMDADRNGWLTIEVHAAPDSPDPNIILNTFWVFPPKSNVTSGEVISGAARPLSELIHECGSEWEQWAPVTRKDLMVAATHGSAQPVLLIRSRRILTFDSGTGTVLSGEAPFVLTQPRATSATHSGDTLVLHFAPGTRRVETVVCTGKPAVDGTQSIPDPGRERERAVTWWTTRSTVPPVNMHVPDARLQYLLSTSIRNIYAIRDRVDGGIQYQPGPTVYRGLWLGDAFISGNISLMLGDTASVRDAMEHGMKFQQASGQFVVLRPATALGETPLFLVTMFRYAAFTGNDTWLRRHWKVIRDGMQWMEDIHRRTYDEPDAPYAGLMPPGFVDGGISHKSADYGTVWWVFITLEHAIDAAERLGYPRDAAHWTTVRQSMIGPVKRAIRRDMKTDERGMDYLPITIGDTTRGITPQRGQYAFLLPLPYADVFFMDDPDIEKAARSTIAMLDSTTREGVIAGSGWMQDGIWPWLGGIHAIAHLYRGNSSQAHMLLQAYADHATSFGTWVEEQQPKAVGTRTAGDMSNAEASAFFVQAVRSFIVRERGTTLHLLDGIPSSWLVPGARTSIVNGGTLFGPVTLDLTIAPDGSTATIRLAPVAGRAHKTRMVLHLESLRAAGFKAVEGPDTGTIDIPRSRAATITLRRER